MDEDTVSQSKRDAHARGESVTLGISALPPGKARLARYRRLEEAHAVKNLKWRGGNKKVDTTSEDVQAKTKEPEPPNSDSGASPDIPPGASSEATSEARPSLLKRAWKRYLLIKATFRKIYRKKT